VRFVVCLVCVHYLLASFSKLTKELELIIDAGITNQVEMEQITRNVHSAIQTQNYTSPPLIVDGDTGYGGPGNMLRTISSLSKAGAAAITIEDQMFPKKCTIAAGDKIRIVSREEAVGRVRGALGARENAGVDPWIVGRTDCRLAYGFDEVVERCLLFEELGAEVVYAENLQSIEEYRRLREKLDRRTITLIAQVQETKESSGDEQCDKKPLLDIRQIGDLGYDLALFGVTPLQCVIGGKFIVLSSKCVSINPKYI
jgi:2-methylisocitrate lyase-like PEP mutase family enzyme